jgi:hypothetical protein
MHLLKGHRSRRLTFLKVKSEWLFEDVSDSTWPYIAKCNHGSERIS